MLKCGCQWLFVSVIEPVNLIHASHSYIFSNSELLYIGRDRIMLTRWVDILRNTRSVTETFLQYTLISTMLCFNVWHWQNWLITLAGPKSILQWTTECAVGNLFYQMPIHICKQASDTVKCYYLLFGGTWKVLHWICSLATIQIKQERCLLVCQLSGFLIVLSWQCNKNMQDLPL